MMLYQQRVLDELKQLTERRFKLGAFLAKPDVQQFVKPDEVERLTRQHAIMVQYEAILQERVDHF